MSGRHRGARLRPTAPTARRLAGAGATAAVAVFAVAPLAHADAKPKPAGDSGTSGTDQSAGSQTTVKKAAVEPNYGTQKIRVGVQEKTGDFYPSGTTTVGTTISITETGPNSGLAATVFGTSCTTVAGADSPAKSYCDFSSRLPQLRSNSALQRRVAAAGVDARRLLALPTTTNYMVFPGDTVTFKQTSVEPNMLIDASTLSFGPCTAPVNNDVRSPQAAADVPVCDTQNAVDELFTDPGLPPVAAHDSGTVKPGGTITIDVLGNDNTKDAPPTIKIVDKPAHGTATVVNQSSATAKALTRAAAPAIKYVPDAGFFGHDSLTYSLTTPNGTATATVSLLVAAPPTARDDSAKTPAGDAVTIDVLANDARNGGGALSIDSVGNPGHGTATIKNGQVVYTPASGFAGTDTFTYVARNSLGTDRATVTVTVSGVANTGTPTGELITVASLLLATGGAASVAGRRRYRARHAGGA